MARQFDIFGQQFGVTRTKYWRRRLILWGIIVAAFLVVALLLWNSFFVYVPPGHHLIVIAKDGSPLPAGQVLAEEGEKGVQRAVQGEGWHFVLPVLYVTEVEKNTDIPPGKVGVITARGGKPLPPGRLLAEEGEQGIQRRVLPPGTYRINRYGFDVAVVDATEIAPGFVGVQRRLLGKEGRGRFAERENETGILRQVLQPGLYYINPKEFEVLKTQVGIFQTTFHYDAVPEKNTAITFTSKGGFPISLDCTVEWEIRPDDMPALTAEYGSRAAVERNVIDVQAHAIGRDKGIDYGVQDFLEGTKREKFQDDFSKELTRVCRSKNVTVHSAFIRNIVFPEAYLKPIRDKQIAAETELTNKAKEATAQSVADVEREQQTIAQRIAEVEAETKKIVAGIDRDVENVLSLTEAELDKLKAEYSAKIATLDTQRIEISGRALAESNRLKETAKAGLYQMKMDVFNRDGEAFLRYSLAQQLNPKVLLRLFHSGPGTFWTNLDNKNLSLMLPAQDARRPDNLQSAPANK